MSQQKYRIIVAGAGHGGLTAAAELARAGHEVTVYETRARNDLGYPWDDAIESELFDFCGIAPSELTLTPYVKAWDRNPALTVTLRAGNEPSRTRFYVDRRELAALLLRRAEDAGVRFVFGKSVSGCVCRAGRVAGVVVHGEEIPADLVIDAAGMDSSVRASLPRKDRDDVGFGIPEKIAPKDTYYVYRAMYDRVADKAPEHSYNIIFFHTGKPGLDWVIDNGKEADVLIGGFGSLERNDVTAALWDLRSEFPVVGNERLAGGNILKIPMRRSLGLFVAPGYAAVGDSAAMTEPMSGSGITLSMMAGTMLARRVIGSGVGISSLWDYEREYTEKLGSRYIRDDMIRGMLSELSPADLDWLFESRVLTAKEMLKADTKADLAFIRGKLNLVKRPALMKPMTKAVGRIIKSGSLMKEMPEKYERDRILDWVERYEKL